MSDGSGACIARALVLALAIFTTTQAHAGEPGCNTLCPTDFNFDGQTDGGDLGALLAAWGSNVPCIDLDMDGSVDGGDLGQLLAAWGPCPPAMCGAAGHDCFTTGGPYCDDADCCKAVCAVDSFCCSVSWDATCVMEAQTFCAAGCSCPASGPYSDCWKLTPGASGAYPLGCSNTACCNTVCQSDCSCCQMGWDQHCVDKACQDCGTPVNIAACPILTTPEGEPCGESINNGCSSFLGSSDCCSGGEGAGCSFKPCADALCIIDPFCCKVTWDAICAAEAFEICGRLCVDLGYGSIECGETICGTLWADGGLRDTDWFLFTLASNASVEVTIEAELPVTLAVVDLPDGNCRLIAGTKIGKTGPCGGFVVIPFCATAGQHAIVAVPSVFEGYPCDSGLNNYLLTLDCGGSCTLCPSSDHDCFSAGDPGCADLVCCELVCAVDSFCCDTQWDGTCVSEAFSLCDVPRCPFECPGGSIAEGEPCGADLNGGCNADPPRFGSIACGATICGSAWATGDVRDTDWYQFTLAVPTLVAVTCSSQLPMVFGIVDTGGDPSCSLASALNPFAVTPFCGTASFQFCLPAGTWWLFAAPNGFNGFPCDSGLNAYSISLECGGECTPLACGSAGHDCFTVGGPFCDDIACCEAVCAVDPYCCDVAWDDTCVGEAESDCTGAGIPANDQCVNAIAIGLGNKPFSTIGATTSGPTLDPDCDRGFGLSLVDDIWYTYTPTSSGTLIVGTCGANYDTRIAAYGGTCESLVLLACNDDFCGLASTMFFPVSAGTTYHIRVGGYSGSGSGTLSLIQ
ncbi:MAG: hypothetical protein U0575_13170 [Phycisphaerales bacterium]